MNTMERTRKKIPRSDGFLQSSNPRCQRFFSANQYTIDVESNADTPQHRGMKATGGVVRYFLFVLQIPGCVQQQIFLQTQNLICQAAAAAAAADFKCVQ